MINGYQSEILKIYENIREEENRALEKRRKEIEEKLPEIINIEQQIGKLCVEVSMSTFKNIKNRDEYIKSLKEKITDLRVQKSELLSKYGYPITYLEHNYKCEKCKDTGFIGTKKCSCYKHYLVKVYYKNSDLKELTRENNFDNFNVEYYSLRKTGSEPESPRKNIEKIVTKCMAFIRNFQSSNENLLFYGPSGTGKSFLSICIAKELLDKGYLVVYRTAENLIQNLKRIRFEGDENLEDLLINCDLLIIDDLGAEQISDFSKTELFNLLNKKILKNKNMIISTNCKLEEILQIYSERISSRLLGNFTLHKFFGDDIRIKKNLNKIR
ncbi:DNA replication protein DnaC [Clostridium sp. USBA 49]|jgi:DNA replication protein DnaC|uniref:ATP-binding protein n=1 Tax=Clostridium TaxID=1485 RepID=UPI00099A69A3|nr:MULTISPECIES: ATP-binding protein [Clostridium]SKA79096.1 DNA replication protein DnaC [Clostridium sp. USBA 49]